MGLFHFTSFTDYIIYSRKLDKYYMGYSEDVVIGLKQYNEAVSTFTSKATNSILNYAEEFPDRAGAHKRAVAIMKKKSRKYIIWLINFKSR